MTQLFEVGARVVSLWGHAGTVVGYYRDNIKVAWDGGGTSCGPISHGGLRPEPEPEGGTMSWQTHGHGSASSQASTR